FEFFWSNSSGQFLSRHPHPGRLGRALYNAQMWLSCGSRAVLPRGHTMTKTICDGLTVLEMGMASVPTAFAGMMLADNGAHVVKLEPPGGDPLRSDMPAAALVWD